jgi:hypothetical protein
MEFWGYGFRFLIENLNFAVDKEERDLMYMLK